MNNKNISFCLASKYGSLKTCKNIAYIVCVKQKMILYKFLNFKTQEHFWRILLERLLIETRRILLENDCDWENKNRNLSI